MTLNVNADSLLATFIEASKMAEKNQDKKLLFGKKILMFSLPFLKKKKTPEISSIGLRAVKLSINLPLGQ